MQKRRMDIPCLLGFALAFWFLAEGNCPAQEVTLRYGHSAGTTLNYHLTLDTPGLQASKKVDLDVIREVASVTAEGVMEVSTTFQSGVMVVNGVSSPFPVSGKILTALLNRRGEIQSTTSMGALADLFARAGLGTSSVSPDFFRSLGILEFPQDPLSSGEGWTVEKNHTFPNGDALNVTYAYTLTGFVSYGGYECAQISIDSQPQFSIYQDFPTLRRGLQVNGQLRISGTLLFAHNEGRIVKLEETLETDAVSMMIAYDGMTKIAPIYQKTLVTLELQ